ncbi:hypothetical protein PHAVU_007G087700 [Phaseolus vulgaris]|uniref:Leucine-rich repeat-containing N-terminal plant-type domain-containing protein n=1 Tax=Phaseolus vulgaris TaxID=3885 RepID=V7BGJ9_PHAVU|nr:hypothetical protein PHAVU_007G087700g [Phaseolus vulgaris]ESW15621.1 hypothetical protein PHAVU_007G087700g [Phaseolus vulgaris]
MLNTGTCNNFTIGCNQKDKLGLLNFKQRVIDLSGVLSSWNPDQDCCQWRRVNCDHITGRVTRLNLPCSIHLFLLLVELEFLNYLNLSNNDFLTLQFDSIHQNCHNLSERNFAKLSKLKTLAIYSSPPLIFDCDSHWVPLFQLERLALGFAGPNLPEWLYTQRYLKRLSIFDSSFVAKSKFWNFVSRVSELDLEYNLIVGNLSNNVLLNSSFVSLTSNDLKGSLSRLSSNVAIFDASNNSLSGTIFPLLCDHKMLNGKGSLIYLDITRNNLSGELTNCWKNWKSLIHVNLGSNNLTGKIPSSMGSLFSLTSLHLHENNLYGTIPTSLQNCHSLLIFNVHENNLSGNIPDWIPHDVRVLQLRSNNFSGNIPTQISSLVFNNASESSLYFSFALSNSLTYFFGDSLELVTKGRVSEYRTNLHFMTLIDMSSNNLFGTVPPQMFSLVGLCSLNFLESLDLSTNQFWGEIPQVSYIGNPDLCGPPLTKICWQDGEHKDSKPIDEDEDKDEFLSWFYIGIESGFVTGFLGVSCALFFNRKWRHAYFRFLYNMRNRFYVMVLIKMNSSR